MRDHEKTTARYQQELKRRRHDTWFKPAPVIELTERDRYRFRVTSALLKGVEKLGGRVQSASVRGLIEFSVTGEKVEFTVAEKMSQRIKRPKVAVPTRSSSVQSKCSPASPVSQ